MPEVEVRYDALSREYVATRTADPYLERLVHSALGNARSVVNVGAGTGSYEPVDRNVIAVEPSQGMIAARPAGAAPAVRARAEALPFADNSFDAAMGVMTDHHWQDRVRGLHELRRVARDRVVLLTWDAGWAARFWLVRDYLTRFKQLEGWLALERVAEALGATEVQAVPVPAACRDGFLHAYWARPHAFLDPRVRASMSLFARAPADEVDRALARLAADLDSGAWAEANAELAGLEELDLGYRLLIADYSSS